MVKVLIVEHDVIDVELLEYELKKNQFECTAEVAQTEEEYALALESFRPDIVLADYNLPVFDAETAFRMKQELLPEIPFIIVSGAIGEENAVALIKKGVTDFVSKDKLYTIVPKINRALQETRERRERLEAEKRLEEERTRHAKMLTRAAIEGQEKERAAIGQDLHDNINQTLSIIKIYISMAEEGGEGWQQLLQQSEGMINRCINDIRAISHQLIPPPLKEEGLISAVDTLIERIRVAKPFSIHFNHEERRGKEIDEEEQLAIYRIIQEQFNNIIKHARATRVDVELKESDEQVFLRITDNGQGFDTGKKGNGVGLNNMLSRVRVFDGDLQIISGRGRGCTLKVSLPKEHEMAH
ncbi:MAG TPA: ATP-binding protein [Puia sp.]|nr:ATP-binding protein [Puia sp.]